jgi:2-polyprenyl-6-methoxyphenol hydroxylase-like FAD-dependent oxidoreductase
MNTNRVPAQAGQTRAPGGLGRQSQIDHAVVIGAGMAGLWTARVLSDHVRRVTVLERDRLPQGAAPRPGVPQDRHVHVLLQRGATIMGHLFPGIEEELLAAGAHRIDLTLDSYVKIRGRWLRRFASGKITYACSRVLLESILRRRVRALPNVLLFDAFAATVDPAFQAAMQRAEPLGKIIGYRRTENRFRHYEKMAHWPDRLVVLGDAVCGFNPVYGQGMTVAAMAAESLGLALDRAGDRLEGLARRFQQGYPRVVKPAWLLATQADLEWLGRKGRQSPAERLAGWYLSKVLDAIPGDRVVHETFLEVQNLMQPPTALFNPQIAMRVMRQWLCGRSGQKVGGP